MNYLLIYAVVVTILCPVLYLLGAINGVNLIKKKMRRYFGDA